MTNPIKTKQSAARQMRRNEALNQVARSKGWASWGKYETAVINGQAQITEKPAETKEE